MSEGEAIGRVGVPATVSSLVADLRRLGVAPGTTLMVHSSLSRLGYVSGGAQAVVQALLEVIGPEGTLMMPTHSGDLSDPSRWENPPVPAEWCDALRAEMPAYDPQLTPTRGMGAVVECFRHVPGVRRSAHPAVSAAAVGPNAAALVGAHTLADGLGETSPQARLYELDGRVLLLGVTHANNTSLHVAEYRAAPPDARRIVQGAPVLVDGRRRWVTFSELESDTDDFERIGEAFASTGRERTGPVAATIGRLMRSRDIVDFAVDWMRTSRTWVHDPKYGRP